MCSSQTVSNRKEGASHWCNHVPHFQWACFTARLRLGSALTPVQSKGLISPPAGHACKCVYAAERPHQTLLRQRGPRYLDDGHRLVGWRHRYFNAGGLCASFAPLIHGTRISRSYGELSKLAKGLPAVKGEQSPPSSSQLALWWGSSCPCPSPISEPVSLDAATILRQLWGDADAGVSGSDRRADGAPRSPSGSTE